MAVFKWPVIQSSGGGGGSGEANTSSNAGSGAGLAKAKSGTNLPFKSLKAGSNVSISASADEVTISATASVDPQTATNTANIAANTTAIASKADQSDLDTTNGNVSGNTSALASKLEATNIIAGSNVTLDKSGNNVTINAAGGGGGSATTDASDLTSGVLSDGRVQESNVTQHQGALSVTESQISDLGSYATTAQLATKSDTSHTHPADPQVATNTTAIATKQPLAAHNNAGNSGASKTLNFATGSVQTLTLTANTTLTLTNIQAGDAVSIVVKQDATGSRAVTWPATVKWPDGTPPTLTTDASSVDIVSLISDGTNLYGTSAKDFI